MSAAWRNGKKTVILYMFTGAGAISLQNSSRNSCADKIVKLAFHWISGCHSATQHESADFFIFRCCGREQNFEPIYTKPHTAIMTKLLQWVEKWSSFTHEWDCFPPPVQPFSFFNVGNELSLVISSSAYYIHCRMKALPAISNYLCLTPADHILGW